MPECVESAARAGSDVEVIVVDDASTDETAIVCKRLQNIKYVRLERNQGVAGARNVGILASQTNYVAFLDDDDLRLPGSLDHQRSLLESSANAGFVAGGVLLADQNRTLTGEIAIPRAESGDVFWQVLELGVHLIAGSVLIRKSCFLEIGMFNRQLAGIDDWDMCTRIAAVRPVILDDQPVCIYRSATPYSGQGSSQQGRHLYSAIKHQPQLLALPRAKKASQRLRKSIRKNTKRRVADTLSWRAAEELARGEFQFAASNFLHALRISPLWAARPTHAKVFLSGVISRRKRYSTGAV